ncbi:hypothetical protein SDC9_158820 [bioreactor metagenome]|uniref:Uncharacterized protein n=1 Tax=bioreactor metagenome TaxID=1076179 RepID=A0A645FB82_9ZZZZ
MVVCVDVDRHAQITEPDKEHQRYFFRPAERSIKHKTHDYLHERNEGDNNEDDTAYVSFSLYERIKIASDFHQYFLVVIHDLSPRRYTKVPSCTEEGTSTTTKA